MDILCSCEKVIQDCCRTDEKIKFTTTQNTKRIDNVFKQKIQILEFYIQELIDKKERFASDITVISSIINRTEQTIKSLYYPQETNLKCAEIRENVSELKADLAQKELRKEIRLIKDTRKFLESQLNELREQLRKHKSTEFFLENDIQQKTKTLKQEKQNDSLKDTIDFDSRIPTGQDKLLPLDTIYTKNSFDIAENWENVKWLQSTQSLLTNGKRELENAQKLICFAEESLSSKTSALITQYNCSNEIFHKRIAQFKRIKDDSETKLLNVNELIHRIRKCIVEIENTFAADEPQQQLSKIRLQERINSNNPELLDDKMQFTLIENQRRQSNVMQELQKKYKEAQSSLTSLIRVKNDIESEIEEKINAIKIDEVECLPLRSSIHYHAY